MFKPIDHEAIDRIWDLLRTGIPIFQNLAEPARQDILRLLTENHELNVQQLTARLHLSRPAVSHHLKVLRNRGLIDARKQGTENYYYLTIQESLSMLSELVALMKQHIPSDAKQNQKTESEHRGMK